MRILYHDTVISILTSIFALAAGCSSSSPGPDSISSHRVQAGIRISNCTAKCHSQTSTASPNPLATNGTGGNGKHVRHVTDRGIPCEKCHFGYENKPTHMNGVLDTPNPLVTIVYFDPVTNQGGTWSNDIGPLSGSCASLNCHYPDTVDWYGPDGSWSLPGCTTCHTAPRGTRRQVLGAQGDFGANANIISHHVTSTAASDPTDAQCRVCHEMTQHMAGTVRVQNADDIAVVAYDPTNPVTLEPFCLSCHDTDGASDSSVTLISGGTPTNPFNDGSVLGDPPYPYAMRVASSWAKSYGHGPNGNHASGSRLTCMGTGAAGTGCHGNRGRINAHGSASQVLASGEFKYDIASTGTYTYNEVDFDLCFSCHAGYANVTKERTLGVKFGGILDTDYGWSSGPRGWNPPYDTGGAFLTHFADHNVVGDPFGLNDPVFWGPTEMNLHWFHLGMGVVSFRGDTSGSWTGIVCVNCHDVHGSNTPYGAVYDEMGYTNFGDGTNLLGQMTLSAYSTSLLNNHPFYCAFNCHPVQDLTKAWYYPITE